MTDPFVCCTDTAIPACSLKDSATSDIKLSKSLSSSPSTSETALTAISGKLVSEFSDKSANKLPKFAASASEATSILKAPLPSVSTENPSSASSSDN